MALMPKEVELTVKDEKRLLSKIDALNMQIKVLELELKELRKRAKNAVRYKEVVISPEAFTSNKKKLYNLLCELDNFLRKTAIV